jgi:hypothetical protein
VTYTNDGDVLNAVCEASGLIFGVLGSHCVCDGEENLEDDSEN